MIRVQLIPVILILGMVFSPLRLAAEVTIIRTLPESGSNQAEAEWKSPSLVDKDRSALAESAPGHRLSGRLIIGGYGSGGSEAATIDDWSTDSLLSFQNFVGENGLFDLQVKAYRDTGIDSFTEQYNGSMAYSSSAVSLKIHGDYDQRETLTYEGEKKEREGEVGVDVSTPDEVRIPLQLHYSSKWDKENTDEIEEEDHSLKLTTEMDLGRALFKLDGGFDIYQDRIDQVSITGYGGSAGCIFTLTEIMGLYIGASPRYSETAYQLTDTSSEEKSVESDLGIILTFSEQFKGEVHGSRIDAWRSDPEFIEEELFHTLIWQGSTSWTLKAPEGLTNNVGYIISQEEGGSVSQDLKADSTWEQEDGFLEKFGIDFRYLLTEAELGLSRTESMDWGGFLTLKPTDLMSLKTDYNGSWSDDEYAINNDAAIEYNHAPIEGFSYGAGAGYAYQETATEYSSAYKGSGRINLMPAIGYKQLNLGLSELYELEDAMDGTQMLSRLSFSSAFPFTKQVKLQYLFSWEWVDLYEAGADEGSAFLHTAGFTLSGPKVPFSLNSTYLVGHGFRGIQHQVDTRLEIPLMEAFNIISKLSYRYAETITYETPFLFSTFAHYEF